MDKRERVARAICSGISGPTICREVSDCSYCMNAAQAAIAALEPLTVQEAACVLIPWFEQQHYNWAVSKGRNPKDYLSHHTHAADILRALVEKNEPKE